MTPHSLAIPLLLALAACKQSTPLPIETPGSDVVVGELGSPAADVDASEGLDPAEVGAPAPGVDGTQVADAADTVANDSADAVAAVDSVQPINWKDVVPAPVPAECTATGVLPNPGEPCTKVGSVRCTNWNATLEKNKGYWPTLCIRPYRVRCDKTPTGATWELEACGALPAKCKDKEWPIHVTCQENSRGAHCCPTNHRQDPVKVGFPPAGYYSVPVPLCLPDWENKVVCHTLGPGGSTGGDYTYQCGYHDTVPADAVTKAGTANAFSLCLEFCKDCLYFYAQKKCPNLDHNQCNGIPGHDVLGDFGPMCLTTIPGKGPTCAMNCEDFQYSKYAVNGKYYEPPKP